MTEIPKNSRSYLAWHEIEGHILVYWANGRYRFIQFDYEQHVNPKHLHRWMDEKGQWHEIKNSRTPNICKRCCEEVIDSIDAQIAFLSESGEG